MNGSTQDSNMKSSAGSNTGSVIDDKSPRPDSLGFGLDPQQLPEKVAEKIQKGTNILIALSKDPNVDEISAAIALAIVLDQQKKHVTAIYSGKTPNTLEFLKPEETFEKDTSSLQDFIIALNKSKADHLTYKLDGDYVKIYITPYKGQVKKEDLEYSYGEYNVDLVIVFNVNAGSEIDSALSEYGRIMHDASAINITSGLPGRFADLEWSDPEKSSVCEMVYNLLKELEITDLSQEVATALLTGILSATERFSNNRTKPTTMSVAAKLMEAGADQQLISANILKPEAPTVVEEKSTNDSSASINDGSANPVTEVNAEPSTVPEPSTATEPSTVSEPADPLKELDQLVNQNLAQAPNSVALNSQTSDSQASTLQDSANLPSAAPISVPPSTANVMEELARMTESMTSNPQSSPTLVPQSEAQPQMQSQPQSQSQQEMQSQPQSQPEMQPQPQPEPQVQPQSQSQPEMQPEMQPVPSTASQMDPTVFSAAQMAQQPTYQPAVQSASQAFGQPPITPVSQMPPIAPSSPIPPVPPVPQTMPISPISPVSQDVPVSPMPQASQATPAFSIPPATQAAPVNPLPSFSGANIVGHTISDPVIESNEDMSRLMDEVLAEPSPIQNPVGYQSLINQGDYINQSLNQSPSPAPQPNPNYPLAIGQQPIMNYVPGQNIATLSAPAMPTMPQGGNYPSPEYTNNIPEYITPTVPAMPDATFAAPTISNQPNPAIQPSQEAQPQSQSQPQFSQEVQPQPQPQLQPPQEPQPQQQLQSQPQNPQEFQSQSSTPPFAGDPMANFIQATPPATSTPIPDFLQPEAFLPPAPNPVVPNQPANPSMYAAPSAVPAMPLPPVMPEPLPTPPIPLQEADSMGATSNTQDLVMQNPTSQNTEQAPQTSASQAPDPSAFRIPGTY